MKRRLTVVDGPLAFGMRRFDAARANDVGLVVLHETDRDPVRTEEALLPAYDLERELDFHYRSVRVAHLDYHLLALRAVHAHRVPGYTS